MAEDDILDQIEHELELARKRDLARKGVAELEQASNPIYTPVNNLEISGGALTYLHRAGIYFVGDLVMYHPDYRQVDGIGPNAIGDIARALESLGVSGGKYGAWEWARIWRRDRHTAWRLSRKALEGRNSASYPAMVALWREAHG
jgi:hypothetical protein